MGAVNWSEEGVMKLYWYIFRQSNGTCVYRMRGKVGPSEDAMRQVGYFAVKSNVDLGMPKELMFVDGEVKKVVKI